MAKSFADFFQEKDIMLVEKEISTVRTSVYACIDHFTNSNSPVYIRHKVTENVTSRPLKDIPKGQTF